jgi:hypothetical protein
MIGGEGSVAFKNNGCGSPRNQPATPGGTNSQGTIDAVIEKHLGHYASRYGASLSQGLRPSLMVICSYLSYSLSSI